MEQAQVLWLIALGALIIFVIIAVPTLQQERQLTVGPPPDGGEGEGRDYSIEPEEMNSPDVSNTVIDQEFYCEPGALKQHTPVLADDILTQTVWAQGPPPPPEPSDPPFCYPGGVAPRGATLTLTVVTTRTPHNPPSNLANHIASIVCTGKDAGGEPAFMLGCGYGGTGCSKVRRFPLNFTHFHSILDIYPPDFVFYFTPGTVRYDDEPIGPPTHDMPAVYLKQPAPAGNIEIEKHTWALSPAQEEAIRNHPDGGAAALASIQRMIAMSEAHEEEHVEIYQEHNAGYLNLANDPPVPAGFFDTAGDAITALRNLITSDYRALILRERSDHEQFDHCARELEARAGRETVIGAACNLATADDLRDECGQFGR